MTKLNIKKGDTVVVIAGKDKGKSGKVLETAVNPNKAVVEGVNIVSKHEKPKDQKTKGGIIKRPAPVEISNLMVICPVCGKATRVARKEVAGKNARICKKCGASLDKEFVKVVKKENKKVAKTEQVETKAEETKTTTTKKTATKKPASEKVSVRTTSAKTTTKVHKTANRGS